MGLGVLKRKPDIKWKKTKEELVDIVKVQKQILEVCSKYLKNGGELVYSTCSILKEENENIVKEFIKEKEKQRKEFCILEQKMILPNQNTDGFYMCKLGKTYK